MLDQCEKCAMVSMGVAAEPEVLEPVSIVFGRHLGHAHRHRCGGFLFIQALVGRVFWAVRSWLDR